MTDLELRDEPCPVCGGAVADTDHDYEWTGDGWRGGPCAVTCQNPDCGLQWDPDEFEDGFENAEEADDYAYAK